MKKNIITSAAIENVNISKFFHEALTLKTLLR